MKRILRSLSVQLWLLLLLALLLAHLLAAVVMAWGESVRVHPLSVRTITTQIMAAYQLARTHAEVALDTLDVPESRFKRLPHPPKTAQAAPQQDVALIATLRQDMRLPQDLPVYVALRPIPADAVHVAADMHAGLGRTQDAVWALDIALALPDGQWLHSQHWPTMMHPHWDRVLQFSFVMSVLASMLIAVLFGRSIMRPLKALAHAAHGISRGENLPPLALQGPHSVRKITQAFNDMQARLHRFVSDRTQMIAAIGHDLRTPLTSLRIRTELISDEALRTAMRASLDDMAAMAQASLHFAQDDATQEPTQTIDLAALIDTLIAHYRTLGHTIAWQASAAIPYRCRPVHLKRALNNLLDNATRYGHVCVQLVIDSEHLSIHIEDDGPGIAPDQLERVFEPFMRLDTARNLEKCGAGLGLSIARSFVRAHGGDIVLNNRPAGGLCAVVTLPRA